MIAERNKGDNLAKTKIREQLKKGEKEITQQSLYGYFSIPYNSTIGDGFYSQESNYHHKVVDRKVIGERRGIYTKPLKSGKGKDAYLKCMDYTEEKYIEKMKEQSTMEQTNYLKQIQERKEAKPLIPFTPAGGSLDNKTKNKTNQAIEPKAVKQIRKAKLQFNTIDMNTQTNHNVNSTNTGFYNTKGILFKLPILPLNIDVWDIQEITKHKKNYKPFVSASFSKNDYFSSNKETFGLFDEGIKLCKDPHLVIIIISLY